MKNIYLVGFMGTGKTTVGIILADKLKKAFVEMDEYIEQKENKKIADIFKINGEPYFRKIEHNVLKELALGKDLVISCGGGVICNDENLKILKETGIVFNLTASPQEIYARTKEHSHRPLLNVSDPLGKIKELLLKRQPYYVQAHYSIDTDGLGPCAVADQIIHIVQNG